ncbi:MAG: putative DNA binding domain-containing protein [Treponema sp.]|jgi:predicted HTH transcriptional regulator|nr:putative DNA binding domain-containing protein [Treponema sp.]
MYENPDQLKKQIALGEDSSLEIKDLRYKGNAVSSPHSASMADELAAMANTTSGLFVLGVDDKTRRINGLPPDKLDSTETWLRNIANDLISPPLACHIRKLSIQTDEGQEKVIISIGVPKSIFVHKSPGGYFHRIGSSKREMPPDILSRLFQQRSQTRLIRFDEQIVYDADIHALSRELWERFKTPLSPENGEEFLIKLKLAAPDEEGVLHPTISGLLMASETPQAYIPNAFIQAVCYNGRQQDARQLDSQDITGPLDIQIKRACQFVRSNMKVAAIKNPGRIEFPQYSMNAVFEAVVNAVAHRDYSIYGSKIRLQMYQDRLELYSPGAIPNTMTIESLPLRQCARNELVTSLLARCRMNVDAEGSSRVYIMDKRGEGVPIIFIESEKLSGIRPEYILIDDAELRLSIFAAHFDPAWDTSSIKESGK